MEIQGKIIQELGLREGVSAVRRASLLKKKNRKKNYER